MKIGVDGRVLEKGMTGTGRYLNNLLIEISKIDNNNQYYIFFSKKISYLPNFYRNIISQSPFIPHKFFSPIWHRVVLPSLLEKHKIDILFSPNILLPLKKKRDVKYITVIHDVFPFTYKDYYSRSYRAYLSYHLPKTLGLADRVITDSEYSKNEITRMFGFSKEKIEVIYHSLSENFDIPSKNDDASYLSISKLRLPQKYLLFVGAIEKRKNIEGLIKIMDNLISGHSDIKLIVIGRPGFGSRELIKELSIRSNHIFHINSIDDGNLRILYKNAFAFLFPSFVEGFGIPALEAMKSGVPVLASNTSSLLEVVSEGGILHPPKDYSAFADDIRKLERDIEFYRIMKEKALKQASKFNRRNEAHKLLNIFSSISFNEK
jgi:glycosyltransferase involved in cell wall biosynthesis